MVLIHGGASDSRCWDRLVPLLGGPALAVDLPGRGAHPADLDAVTFADCAESVRADIDAAGFGDVMLVGHSLAGCSMPAIIGALGERVRRAVFVACTVPATGQNAIDTLDPDVQERLRHRRGTIRPRPMDGSLTNLVLGDDLDDEQLAWCLARVVPEAPRLASDPVDLSPLKGRVPRSWICTLRDLIIPAEKQRRFAGNVGNCPVLELDAGHMCMVSEPSALAAMLNDLAG
jgi:pimeloyl-ACP methyl ester carboxylesterase